MSYPSDIAVRLLCKGNERSVASGLGGEVPAVAGAAHRLAGSKVRWL